MDKVNIRQGVFETNSSSSHSLTIAQSKLNKAPFNADISKRGILEIRTAEFGWEWQRYRTPEQKINYLVTQMVQQAGNGDEDWLKSIIALKPEFIMLCKVVKEYSGVTVQLEGVSGYIDHQSVGVGNSCFKNETTLKQFLFCDESYIETGNDNSEAPQVIETEVGSEEY